MIEASESHSHTNPKERETVTVLELIDDSVAKKKVSKWDKDEMPDQSPENIPFKCQIKKPFSRKGMRGGYLPIHPYILI